MSKKLVALLSASDLSGMVSRNVTGEQTPHGARNGATARHPNNEGNKMDRVTRARAAFLTWLKNTHPSLYERVLSETESGAVAGLGQEETSWWQRMTEGLMTLGTTYIGLKSQKEILDANIKRAEQGLEPIDMSTGAPVVRTEVGISPEVIARLQSGMAAGGQQILMWGGLAVLAFMLLRR